MLSGADRRLVETFVERLSGALGPALTRVVAYGSRTRGDDQPGSDLDLLVLTATEPGLEQQRIASLIAYDLWEESDFAAPELQPVVVAEAQYAAWLDRRLTFASNVERDGQSVWPAG